MVLGHHEDALERILPKCYYGHASQSASCSKLLSCCLPWLADSRPGEEGGMLVLEDLTRRGRMVTGVDKNSLMTFAQLEAALTYLQRRIKEDPPSRPEPPARPDKSFRYPAGP